MAADITTIIIPLNAAVAMAQGKSYINLKMLMPQKKAHNG